MNAKYVRTKDGLYLLQVEDENLFRRWGFALVDDDGLTYEGGFGIANEWTVVPDDEVPEEFRRRLELAFFSSCERIW
jgi:hypothetical protein